MIEKIGLTDLSFTKEQYVKTITIKAEDVPKHTDGSSNINIEDLLNDVGRMATTLQNIYYSRKVESAYIDEESNMVFVKLLPKDKEK